MPRKYQIPTRPAPPRFRRIGKYGIVDRREDCSACRNCVKRECIYDCYKEEDDRLRFGSFSKRTFPPAQRQEQRRGRSRGLPGSRGAGAGPGQPIRRSESSFRKRSKIEGYADYLYECKNCLCCVQSCTKGLLSRKVNPEFEALGDSFWSPDVISITWYQAETGKIPVSGAGYGGPFVGPGFDAMWTDMSEIVRPTRDGIHGREYISTSVDVGRKLPRLRFDPEGELGEPPVPIADCRLQIAESEIRTPTLLEVPVPLIFDVVPLSIADCRLQIAESGMSNEEVDGRRCVSTLKPRRMTNAEAQRRREELNPKSEIAFPDSVRLASARAARRLGIFVIVRLADLTDTFEPFAEAIVPLLDGEFPPPGRGWMKRIRMVEIEDADDVIQKIGVIKKANPSLAVAVRVRFNRESAERVVQLSREGVSIIHLYADVVGQEWEVSGQGAGIRGQGSGVRGQGPGARGPSAQIRNPQSAIRNPQSPNPEPLLERRPRHISRVTRDVHLALVEAQVRDEVTLIGSGGIALAEHMAKEIICGADLVGIDMPVPIALECRVCGSCLRGLECPVELANIDLGYATQRIMNLVGAWRSQLLEVLGAMGIREVRRLRGEVGRAMFFEDLERESFGPIFGRRKTEESLTG